MLWGGDALAQAADDKSPATQSAAAERQSPTPGPQSGVAPGTGQPESLWARSSLFGTMGGLRPWLDEHGVTIGLQETSELFDNTTGGVEHGHNYHGLTQFGFGVDTAKAFGLPGGIFNLSALQIHGRSITQDKLQTLQTASGIEANATTRLWELWYQQSFFDGKFDVRVGQQSADQEFMLTQYGGTLLNAAFGWPALPSADLPAGGPAYPLSSLGVRVRARPTDSLTFLGAVFDGNPAGSNTGDPQALNRHGTNFNLRSGMFAIAEVQYAVNAPPADPAAAPAAGLPGTYKLGAWYQSQHIDDLHVDRNGLSLANPGSDGLPRQHRGNYSFYAVADQMVWRPSADSPRSVGVFARVMGAPGDRNLIDFSADAGLSLSAPFKGRDNDTFSLGLGYAKIGKAARDLDRDMGRFDTPGYPVRSGETFMEMTYQYEIAPWWHLQADLQYFFNVAGGVPNPNDTARRIGNEVVLGLRTNIVF